MDSERQPLLYPVNESRQRHSRPLTTEEVRYYQNKTQWRRSRYILIFLFWTAMVACISIITSILITSPPCNRVLYNADTPVVPPVHITFAPLVSQGKIFDEVI